MPLNYSSFENNNNSNDLKNLHDKYMNGRIVFDGKRIAPFELFQGEHQETSRSYSKTTLESTMETTPVSKLFFSKDNRDYIHSKIIDEVFIRTNQQQKIGKQSDVHLTVIMRSVYLQYGKNLFCDIQKQVNDLNKIVIEDCVTRIMSEIEQRLNYNKFISQMPEQMPLPKNPSIKGNKIIYSKLG
jgi:hypothetical protein